jgi:protein CpxP
MSHLIFKKGNIMSQETEQVQEKKCGRPCGKRRGGRLLMLGLFVVALGSVAVMGVTKASEGTCWHGGHGMGMHDMMDPAAQEKHLDAMIKHVLPDGTAEQKAKLHDIAKAAMTDLHAMRTQHEQIHQQTVKLLTAATIDRPAIEQERQQIMHLADQASLRITQAVEDAAEVLTPDQRLKLAEHLKKHMG